MDWKASLKKFLPQQLHHLYNRLVSRRIIKRRLGSWFDPEWKQRSQRATESEWARTYDRSWLEWTMTDLTHLDLENIAAAIPPNALLADIGCGDGLLLSRIASTARFAVGCDISRAGLLRARQRLGQRFPLVQCNMERLPFRPGCLDAVVCAHTLEHCRDLNAATGELKRVGRRLVVLVPVQEYLPYTEDYHLQFFCNESDLRDAFALPQAVIHRYQIPAGEAAFSGEVLMLVADTVKAV